MILKLFNTDSKVIQKTLEKNKKSLISHIKNKSATDIATAFKDKLSTLNWNKAKTNDLNTKFTSIYKKYAQKYASWKSDLSLNELQDKLSSCDSFEFKGLYKFD